jgi:hypothetical protein
MISPLAHLLPCSGQVCNVWHLVSPVYSWPFIYTVPALPISSPLLLVQLLYLSSLMPLKWLSKHLFRPVVYAHTCLSLPVILSILSVSEMLVEASELFFECSLVSFICFPNAHLNPCLQYTWSWTPIVNVQVTHLFTVFSCLLLLPKPL